MREFKFMSQEECRLYYNAQAREFYIPGKLYEPVAATSGFGIGILMYLGVRRVEYTLDSECEGVFMGADGSLAFFHVHSSLAKNPRLYLRRVL